MTYRERRERGRWTLQEIASLAEINISTLHRIETRGVKPNRRTERAIEAALAIKESEPKENAS